MSVRGYAYSFLSMGSATLALWAIRAHLDKAYIGLAYLLIIAWVAAANGTGPALFACVLGFLSWDYFFLPPYFTLYLNSSEDWILLFVFLAIGMLIGQMAGSMRAREAESLARERDTQALYGAILMVNAQISLQPLTEEAASCTGAKGCAILATRSENNGDDPGEAFASGDISELKNGSGNEIAGWSMQNVKAVGLPPLEPPATVSAEAWPVSVSHSEAFPGAESRFDVFLPLYTAKRNLGLLYAAPRENRPFNPEACRLFVAFAGIATAFLERKLLLQEAAQMAASRESEKLRAVLFSSLSHNLKTPLASLSTTLNSTLGALRESQGNRGQSALLENLLDMSEDVKRLTGYIEKLLNLARLESGGWKPKQEWVELQEIVGISMQHLPETDYERISLSLSPHLPMIHADSVQISQVLNHLLENALAYSPPNSRVKIYAEAHDGLLELSVEDTGPGIPAEEKEKVFHKFYRGGNALNLGIRGTGLGLSICREIIEAHGGTIRAHDGQQGGTRMSVTLPVKPKPVKVFSRGK